MLSATIPSFIICSGENSIYVIIPLVSLYDVKPRHLSFDCVFINDGQTNHTPSFLNSAQKYYIEQFTTFNDNHNDEQNYQTE